MPAVSRGVQRVRELPGKSAELFCSRRKKMAMTITEKILAAHAGREAVAPGEIVRVPVDLALANDITAPLAIREFERAGAREVFDRHKIVLVPDHFAPNKDIMSAEQCKQMRDFARKMGITHYYEIGRMGVEHALLPEEGLVRPGMVIITYGAMGAFSTGMGSTDLAAAWITGWTWLKVPESMKFVVTGKPPQWIGGKDIILHILGRIGVDGARYRSMEFAGEAIRSLDLDGRLSLCNMAVEGGAKNGIIEADALVEEYLKGRTEAAYEIHRSDDDAGYVEQLEIDVSRMQPQVACPHSPDNVKDVGDVGEVKIDQAFIGSCTNGRLADLRDAAEVLKGRKVDPSVRLIVIPATQAVYAQAMREGLLEIFIEAGGAVSTPTCGPCLGGHMGILAEGETAVATSNRNFIGRMGHTGSRVYLANPAVTAASAVLGRIVSPAELDGRGGSDDTQG
jgi:3-isopropylmalate/(R)-2-methylmalate dehydratase large subunit